MVGLSNPKDFPGGSAVNNLPAVLEIQEMWVQSLGWEDPLRRAWQPTPVFLPEESPWTEEPGGLYSMGTLYSYLRNYYQGVY